MLLYDSGQYQLSEEQELTNKQLLDRGEEYFEQWFESGQGFLIDCHNAKDRNDYKKSAFYLHQASEHFLHCAILVVTGYKPKLHDLFKLINLCASFEEKFNAIFPLDEKAKKETFELLNKSYIDARYKRNFQISTNQLDYLINRINKLEELVKQTCQNHLDSLKK